MSTQLNQTVLNAMSNRLNNKTVSTPAFTAEESLDALKNIASYYDNLFHQLPAGFEDYKPTGVPGVYIK